MSTLIELEEPFKSKWRKGYLQTDPDGRRHIHLYNSNSDRTIIPYARYLYGVKEGFEVPAGIEIDHKDGDKTNDDITNLTPMTEEMHRMKTAWERPREKYVNLECPQCQSWFERTERYVRDKKNQGQKALYCSRSCATKANASNLSQGISPETQAAIKRMRKTGKSSYAIASELSIARNTVMKYW